LNVVWSTDLLVCGHVDSADLDNSLELLGSLLPLRCQVLAVAAPWRVELNEPQLVRLHDLLLPIVLGEEDDWASLVVES